MLSKLHGNHINLSPAAACRYNYGTGDSFSIRCLGKIANPANWAE